MDDFLKPESMLTPGLAGALAMAITNALTSGFQVNTPPWPALICLIISFLIGLVVLGTRMKPVWRKLVYYCLNSLVIFVVATGTNTVGVAVTQGEPAHKKITSIHRSLDQPAFSIVATAWAKSDTTKGWCCLNNRVNTASKAECDKWGGKFFGNEAEALAGCKQPDKKRTPSSFFKQWL